MNYLIKQTYLLGEQGRLWPSSVHTLPCPADANKFKDNAILEVFFQFGERN